MKPTEIIRFATFGVLVLYIAYGVMSMPFPFFLLSAAIGLITYGVTESVELTAALTLLTGALTILIGNYKRKEPFTGGNPVEITKRLQAVERPQPKAPVGVYASGYVEGFEDITTGKKPDDSTAAESKPAPAASTATASATVPVPTPAPAPTPPTETKAGFKNQSGASQDGLFKLGVLPEEGKGGFHIDQGTTVLNALNALKPDEVKRMSDDTQKLIDTQKSLMMMLGSMKPMLSDGKQLIDTFQQMFGPNGSPTMPQMSV